VELPYLDNKLQQVASLWEESQLFVLCSFTKFAFAQRAAVYTETILTSSVKIAKAHGYQKILAIHL
jgi:N-acyl-L-homoserine lactone synthetase